MPYRGSAKRGVHSAEKLDHVPEKAQDHSEGGEEGDGGEKKEDEEGEAFHRVPGGPLLQDLHAYPILKGGGGYPPPPGAQG